MTHSIFRIIPFPYFAVLTFRTSGKNYLCLVFRALQYLVTYRLTRETKSVRLVAGRNPLTHEGRNSSPLVARGTSRSPPNDQARFACAVAASSALTVVPFRIRKRFRGWSIFAKALRAILARRPSRWRCLSAVGDNNAVCCPNSTMLCVALPVDPLLLLQ